MFQFLIGRLKTPKSASCSSGTYAFQFLIGRLKTRRLVFLDVRLSEFQFLIGRLKTTRNALRLIRKGLVSIPHR